MEVNVEKAYAVDLLERTRIKTCATRSKKLRDSLITRKKERRHGHLTDQVLQREKRGWVICKMSVGLGVRHWREHDRRGFKWRSVKKFYQARVFCGEVAGQTVQVAQFRSQEQVRTVERKSVTR